MNVKDIITGLALSILLSSGMAVAADYDKGTIALDSGDYKAALVEFIPLAEQGAAYAQADLGYMYEFGYGVLKNYKTAVKWYTLAAEQGHASGQNNLGLMYQYGKGVLTDTKRAYMWYSLASYNGNEKASKNKDKIAKDMTSAQIDKAQDMSSRCLNSGYTDC